jgi:hypothetical protein
MVLRKRGSLFPRKRKISPILEQPMWLPSKKNESQISSGTEELSSRKKKEGTRPQAGSISECKEELERKQTKITFWWRPPHQCSAQGTFSAWRLLAAGRLQGSWLRA